MDSNQSINEESGLRQWWRQFKAGVQQGIAASPENRREMLTAIRELEGKAEGPRAIYTLIQNPLLDAVRQDITFNDREGLQTLGLPKLTDDALLYRANSGMLTGPRPEDVIPKEMWMHGHALPADPIRNIGEADIDFERRAKPARQIRDRNLSIYKQALANIPAEQKLGSTLSMLASDLSHDATRGLWWLINAAQAPVNLASEITANVANPDLFGAKPITNLQAAEEEGLIRFVRPSEKKLDQVANSILERNKQELEEWNNNVPEGGYDELITDIGKPAELDKGIAKEMALRQEKLKTKNYVASNTGVKNVRGGFKQRRFNPNLVNLAAMLPAAVGINAGVGLLGGEDSGTIIPGTGRKAGYEASIPSEDDPRVTDNVALNALNKYFLGREGRLLGWSEGFKEERPDVNRKEYSAYKAYERDRSIDLNPFDDGIVNLGGVLKVNLNDDAIHGKEAQFLGKNISVNESVIPTLGAIAGTAAGAILPNVGRLRLKRDSQDLKRYIPNFAFEREASGKIKRDASGSPLKKFNYKMDGRKPARDEQGNRISMMDGVTEEYYSDDLAKVNRYRDDGASPLTKMLGYIPEVIPRDPATGKIRRNTSFKTDGVDRKRNSIIKGIEDFYLRKPGVDKAGKPLDDQQDLRRDRVLGTLVGAGFGGLVGGQMLGSSIEDERRRRNFEENLPGLDYDTYKNNLERIVSRQREIMLANPNRQAEKEESKAGFNNRAYQLSLMDSAAQKQTAVDIIADKYLQSMAQRELDSANEDMRQVSELERKIWENQGNDLEDYPYQY